MLLVLLAVTPSAFELLEWGVHAAWHGDFAHADDGDHEQAKDEHGCTTLFHTCGCHVSALATASSGSAVGVVPPPGNPAGVPLPSALAGRLTDPPPQRPPIV